jgi:hypothetical protein
LGSRQPDEPRVVVVLGTGKVGMQKRAGSSSIELLWSLALTTLLAVDRYDESQRLLSGPDRRDHGLGLEGRDTR